MTPNDDGTGIGAFTPTLLVVPSVARVDAANEGARGRRFSSTAFSIKEPPAVP